MIIVCCDIVMKPSSRLKLIILAPFSFADRSVDRAVGRNSTVKHSVCLLAFTLHDTHSLPFWPNTLACRLPINQPVSSLFQPPAVASCRSGGDDT